MKFSRKKLQKSLLVLVLSALFLSLSPVLPTVPVHAETATGASIISNRVSADEYKQYLQDNYNLTLSASPAKGEFVNAVDRILQREPSGQENHFTDLTKESPYFKAANALFENGVLTEPALQADQPLTELSAAFIALKAANLKELAYTYPEAKVQTALEKIHLDSGSNSPLSGQAAQEIAAAVDTGIIPPDLYGTFQPDIPASDDFTYFLLGKILTFNGAYKHYIGYVQDESIYNNVYEAYTTQDIISASNLRNLFDTGLKQNLITGYNLKDSRYNANFDQKRSLVYGHDDITHGLQLIGLLKSEGINAKVQLEPKTSAYIYLKEWGEPVQTDRFQVVQIDNGNFIAYAKEYDISFEFDTVEQKIAFQDIVSKYAKKNEKDQTGLIASSWWQPLYYSLTELKDYKVIANNKVTSGHYYGQSFSLENQTSAIAAGLKKIDPNVNLTSYTFWVDEPFYHYLLGDYK